MSAVYNISAHPLALTWGTGTVLPGEAIEHGAPETLSASDWSTDEKKAKAAAKHYAALTAAVPTAPAEPASENEPAEPEQPEEGE